MNKRGLFGMIMFFIIIISLVVVGNIGMYKEQKQAKTFCQDNGFETYERGIFRTDNDVCIKVEDGYRVEKEFNKCGKVYCFIRTTRLSDFNCYVNGTYYPDYYCDALVSGDEQ